MSLHAFHQCTTWFTHSISHSHTPNRSRPAWKAAGFWKMATAALISVQPIGSHLSTSGTAAVSCGYFLIRSVSYSLLATATDWGRNVESEAQKPTRVSVIDGDFSRKSQNFPTPIVLCTPLGFKNYSAAALPWQVINWSTHAHCAMSSVLQSWCLTLNRVQWCLIMEPWFYVIIINVSTCIAVHRFLHWLLSI